ncbi:MAG: hypothetical protein SVR81_00525 [Chloroflexota bacterium]|nr:hypothetical protein [Chloroflexota bacterium]
MDKKVVLSGLLGGLTILAVGVIILFAFNGFAPGLLANTSNVFLGLIPLVVAPIAGGFLAGLIARHNPKRAGLFAGLLAALVLLIGWLIVVGLTLDTFVGGFAVGLVWVILARIFAGFAAAR